MRAASCLRKCVAVAVAGELMARFKLRDGVDPKKYGTVRGFAVTVSGTGRGW